MASVEKILGQMSREPSTIRFAHLLKVCEDFFGKPRQSGSSHIVFKTPWIGDPRINIQNYKGKAKTYQVKQVLHAIEKTQGAQAMRVDHYTYRVTWSPEDGEYLGLCAEFPSLSWLAASPEKALSGMRKVIAEVVADMQQNGESVPVPLAEKHYSGEFKIRIPPQVHRSLAMEAAEQGVSLNRLASAKLAC